MAQKRVHAFYSGRVQGVGFRYTAEAVAQNLGITGWVSNLRDGKVELLAEGDEADLNDLLKRLSEEMAGYVKDADISWEEPTGEFSDFGIRFPR
ncbi:MAG: acylphosphatase [Candidatus Omnitrophota bacterium]|nr:acylphosphatase [Candidatus Omnitrophota bacterium]